MQICNASHSIDKHLSIFIAHLSTATDLTNQIMTPAESGIMDGRHETKSAGSSPLFSPLGHARLADFHFRPAPLGNLFAGYHQRCKADAFYC